MQQHQQQAGGGGGPQSYGRGAAAEVVMSDEDQKLGDLGIAEAASPISSRPPAPAGIGNANFEEMMAEAGGGSSSNRWPRQETLALLQIRSEMDIAFRDATLKGPLWDQVSRKLGELGYKRSAKKCKEKFENVHKYYKRTKEGRGGRQDGKSYKFFSQLEALHHTTSTSPLPRMLSPAVAATVVSLPPPPMMMASQPDAVSLPPTDHHPAGASLFGNVGISFSSDGSSSDEEDDEEMEIELPGNRKRKRSSHGGGGGESDERMMEFFEGLLKQVMQKQEAMQQRFLEAIEKREQDRMIREEAWKRQDMARIAREHDLMAQERAISASRDAAIIDFLQKITGQTIPLPTNPPQEQQPPQPERRERDHDHLQPQHHQQTQNVVEVAETTTTSDHAAIPQQQQQQMMPVLDLAAGGSSNVEASSSRWPKAEVIALIKLRSSMESRYQEAGPKGPLWEEISAGMKQIGYNRSSKRCKEKWENINKYFKKVKESNKKRPEDAKTCPYFNELDALYRRKIIGNTTSSSNLVINAGAEQETKQQREDVGVLPPQSQDKDGGRAQPQTSSGAGAFSSNRFGEHGQSNVGGEKQPEDMLNKGHQQSENYCNSVNCSNSDDLDEDNYEEDDENEEYDEKTEEEMKMVYKIQFQRQNVGSSNGGGTTSPSFVAMVQ